MKIRNYGIMHSVHVISIWLVLHGCCFGNHLEESENEPTFLMLKLPRVTADNESISKLIDRIEESMRDGGAEEMGFKGIILGVPDEHAEEISFDLKEIPVVVLLGHLSTIVSADMMVKDGYILLIKRDVTTTSSAPVLIPFSKEVLEGLGFPEDSTARDVEDCLRRHGLNVPFDPRIIVASETGALVMLKRSEAVLLESILELIRRGVRMNPGSKPIEE